MKSCFFAVSAFFALVLGAAAQYASPAIPLTLRDASRAATAPGRPAVGAPDAEAEPAGLPDDAVDFATADDFPDTADDSRPWWAFWRSDSSRTDETGDDDADEPAEPPPCWILETADGSVYQIPIESVSFEFDVAPESFAFSTNEFSALFTLPDPDRPGKFLLLAPFANARPFALVAPLPSTLKVRTADGEKISVPWSDVLSFRAPDASPAAPQVRAALKVAVTADGEPEPLDAEFPVAFIPFKFQSFNLLVPSWNIESVVVNPDRSVTLVSRFGDVLTGQFPLRKFDGFEDVRRIDFKPIPARFAPKAPANAFRVRLRSGDLLVAVPDPDSDAPLAVSANPAAPAARSLRGALAPAAEAAPADCDVLLPLFRNAPVTLPGAIVETVVPEGAPLPPANAPYAPSARLTDEILLPAGSFHLGSAAANVPANESPSVEVAIDPVYMARTPVTVAQYASFVAETGYRPVPEARSWDAPGFQQTPLDPVVAVSWRDAAAYCNWLSRKAGLTPAYVLPPASRAASSPVVLNLEADGYRLPLEAEWEYAARDLGRPISFPWGDDATEETALANANFTPMNAPRTWRTTSPVTAFQPSPLGFHDLAGNAAEWCQDAYVADAYSTAYQSGELAAILNPPAPTKRVIRGGSFLSPLVALRTTARAFGLELVGVPNEESPRPRVGFRVVRNAP